MGRANTLRERAAMGAPPDPLPRGALLLLEDYRAMTDAKGGSAKERAAFMGRACLASHADLRQYREILTRDGFIVDVRGEHGEYVTSNITAKGRAALERGS